jgi:hypothetical protein
METVYTFKTRRFTLELAAEPENDTPDWFGAEKDIQRIERGELVYFIARVRVLLDGRELASDYLGGCCYESAGSFRQDPYFFDMARSAIKDARAAIRNTPRLRAA